MRKQIFGLVSLGLLIAGCHTDMWKQPKTEPLDESASLFADGAASRPLVPGSIARGHLRLDDGYFTGIENGKFVDQIPLKLVDSAGKRKTLLLRGQERYNIYCSPCHGQVGDGKGMIAQRGFSLKRPVGNYHTDRLRNMPVGHFYDVITNGYGAMYSYASRVEPQDRWAIVAYIRALQLSQHASPADADQADLSKAQAQNETNGRLAQK